MSSENQLANEKDETTTRNPDLNIYQNDVVVRLLHKMIGEIHELEPAPRFNDPEDARTFADFIDEVKESLEMAASTVNHDIHKREVALASAQLNVARAEAKLARVHAKMGAMMEKVDAKIEKVGAKMEKVDANMEKGAKMKKKMMKETLMNEEKDEELAHQLAKLKEKEKKLRKEVKEQRKEMKKAADEWSK